MRVNNKLLYILLFFVVSIISMSLALSYAQYSLLRKYGNAPLNSEKSLKVICSYLLISTF